MKFPGANEFADSWHLDPTVVFLNHGAFGACPIPVLAQQQRFRQQLEQEPLRFIMREFEPLLEIARQALAAFVGTDPADLVFVPNATTGANSVLRSLSFEPGDELLTTDHCYNACRNALEFVARRSGAKVVVATVPFPLENSEQIVASVMRCVTPRTKLALLDHITSQTALIFPIKALVRALAARGIDTLVDGAHAPGMIPLNLQEIGAAYYTGNCHKWMCAPKGAAFLVVQRDRQAQIRPLTISHGANSPRTDYSRFQLEFGWTGTHDPTPYLCIPAVLQFMDAQLPQGGWQAVMDRNRALALQARQLLAETLSQPLPCPDGMVGAIAALLLPSSFGTPELSPAGIDALQDWLWNNYKIEVPVIPWASPPQKILRVSAQLYNHLDQYRYLAAALQSR
ncbi:aminotransferase class V-fold PLP-dependent enzyme [Altericista sp. CCNU0014]|uniref:aminotransferase class V-fold PLP-dependent enzyme n=1 Tax=Altericista sp. CCNU0014 TaxID=3082949 RepID=UPI00384EFC34